MCESSGAWSGRGRGRYAVLMPKERILRVAGVFEREREGKPQECGARVRTSIVEGGMRAWAERGRVAACEVCCNRAPRPPHADTQHTMWQYSWFKRGPLSAGAPLARQRRAMAPASAPTMANIMSTASMAKGSPASASAEISEAACEGAVRVGQKPLVAANWSDGKLNELGLGLNSRQRGRQSLRRSPRPPARACAHHPRCARQRATGLRRRVLGLGLGGAVWKWGWVLSGAGIGLGRAGGVGGGKGGAEGARAGVFATYGRARPGATHTPLSSRPCSGELASKHHTTPDTSSSQRRVTFRSLPARASSSGRLARSSVRRKS
jgi:hypothetical protein